LAEKYSVHGFPTLLFTRPDGTEIDRIIGYRPPEEFLAEARRIAMGDNTLESLYRQIAADPQDVEAHIQLARKLEDAFRLADNLEIWLQVRTISESGTDNFALGDFKWNKSRARNDTSAAILETYLERNPASPYEVEALQDISRIHRANRDTLAEAQTFRRYVDATIAADQATAYILNGYGWRMTQLSHNLEDALERTRLGISLVPEDDPDFLPGIMDTEAEILWKLGRTEEAVQVIDKCIELDSEDEYFKEQRAKFLSTGNTD
jgi:tetratricopeptide (TPR) repeat protein